MDDLETEFSLTQKRHLLDLKRWLERQRTYREKIKWIENTLAEDGFENPKSAAKVLLKYKRKLAYADEAVELGIHILGLIDKKFDLKKQLAEISED